MKKTKLKQTILELNEVPFFNVRDIAEMLHLDKQTVLDILEQNVSSYERVRVGDSNGLQEYQSACMSSLHKKNKRQKRRTL